MGDSGGGGLGLPLGCLMTMKIWFTIIFGLGTGLEIEIFWLGGGAYLFGATFLTSVSYRGNFSISDGMISARSIIVIGSWPLNVTVW